MMAPTAPHFGLNIMRGPRSQGMGKSNRYVLVVVTRAIILIVPDDESAGIVASGAIGFRMPRMFRRAVPDCRIVASGALRR